MRLNSTHQREVEGRAAPEIQVHYDYSRKAYDDADELVRGELLLSEDEACHEDGKESARSRKDGSRDA